MKKRGRARATHLHSSILSTRDTSASNALIYRPRIVAIIVESLFSAEMKRHFYLNMCEQATGVMKLKNIYEDMHFTYKYQVYNIQRNL